MTSQPLATPRPSTGSVVPHDGSWPSDPFDGVQRTFVWLAAGPNPVSIDGRLFEYLPDRDIPIDELGALLMADECPRHVWDAVWAHVILRARLGSKQWTMACVGLALPALRRIACKLTHQFADDPSDIHAEILRGFLDRLDTVDLDQGRIMIRLRWAAYRAGLDARNAVMDGPAPRPPGFCSQPPPHPFGHEDLVLVRAVTEGVVTETEAALIGTTRLEPVTLSEWAAAFDVSYAQVQRSRLRAEHRLAAWLGVADELDAEQDPTGGEATARLALAGRPPSAAQPRSVTKTGGRCRSDRALRSGLFYGEQSVPSPAAGASQAVTSCA
jgi:hypothetical protein